MQGQHTKIDFTGQHLYIGLDIHRKRWQIAILTEHNEHKHFSQEPDILRLVNYLRRMFPGATYHCTYEAGYSGFWIHDALEQHGINCVVVNPADVPTTQKEHNHKTDRVDARKLARNLRNGEIRPIYTPERKAVEDRSIVRVRSTFVKKQTRCKNQIKAFLGFYGIEIPDELVQSHWSRRYLLWLEQLTMQQPSGQQTLALLLEELQFLRQRIAKVTKQIRTLAEDERYRTDVSNLCTIPGISVLSAMIFLTEIITIQRFPSLDALKSYCGLIPGEYSSGETERITGIASRRNPYLRTLLVECAWVAIRKDPALLQAFTTLARRMPKNKAIISIAKKLLSRIRFVLLHGQPYQLCTISTVA